MDISTIKGQKWAIAWTAVIFVLCSMGISGKNSHLFFKGFDKMVHLGFFYILTVLLLYGKVRMQHNYSFRTLTIVKIIIITAIIGGGIELLQWQVFTWRSGDWWDFFSDMIGVLIAIAGYVLLHSAQFNEKNS